MSDHRRILLTLDDRGQEVAFVPLLNDGLAVVSRANWDWLRAEGFSEEWTHCVPATDNQRLVCSTKAGGPPMSISHVLRDAGRAGNVVKI